MRGGKIPQNNSNPAVPSRASPGGAGQPVLSGGRRGRHADTGRPLPPPAQGPPSPPGAMDRGRTARHGSARLGTARHRSPSLPFQAAAPTAPARRCGRAGGRGSLPGEALPYLLPEVDGDVGDAERDQEPDQGPVVSERWKFHHSPSCALTRGASAAAGDGAGGRRGGRMKGHRRRVRACPCACVRAGRGWGGDKGEGEEQQSPLKIKSRGAGGGPVRSLPARRGAGWAAGRAVLPP